MQDFVMDYLPTYLYATKLKVENEGNFDLYTLVLTYSTDPNLNVGGQLTHGICLILNSQVFTA